MDSATTNRQAVRLYSADPNQGFPYALAPVYDPVERVVEYRLPPGGHFEPDTLYHFELLTPSPDNGSIRAFDGAPLEEGELPLRISFITSEGPAEPLPAPPAVSCDQVVNEVFGTLGSCAGAECHRRGNNMILGGEALGDAPHQLWLDNVGDFRLSAINRVARQAEVADVSGGVPAASATRFGARMALIAPGLPGASYLLYKLLLNPDSYLACDRGSSVPLCETAGDPCVSTHAALPLTDGNCVAPTEEELVRLREWFVRGEPMPRPNSRNIRGNVHLQGLRALSAFITDGADCGP